MSGLHHHEQHPTTKRRRGENLDADTVTEIPTNTERYCPDSCVFSVRRRTTASLPAHIQHKYFSQAVETMAEMLKLVTSHCALVESCGVVLASNCQLSRCWLTAGRMRLSLTGVLHLHAKK